MRSNGFIFAIICVFCIGSDIVYWFTSKDPTGTACLAITAGLAFLLSFYLLMTVKRFGTQPMDNIDGEISDAAGLIGHFTAASWYPIAIALAATLTAFGFIFGIWLAMIGLALVIATVTGLLFENLHEPTLPENALTPHH